MKKKANRTIHEALTEGSSEPMSKGAEVYSKDRKQPTKRLSKISMRLAKKRARAEGKKEVKTQTEVFDKKKNSSFMKKLQKKIDSNPTTKKGSGGGGSHKSSRTSSDYDRDAAEQRDLPDPRRITKPTYDSAGTKVWPQGT